jgi:ubiquinone/menaquinone biosynthesis C-methylase UbiE
MQSRDETSAKLNAALKYQKKRQTHWDNIARKKDHWQSTGAYYHTRLSHIYANLVSPGQKVLELGCGTGELLASLKPSLGVGVDLSGEMVKRAATKFPELRFIQADSHDLVLNEPFDIIILSDILNELWDVQSVFERLQRVSDLRTRIIINSYSQVWQLPLTFGQILGLSTPLLTQNWLTVDDIENMLGLAGFEIIRHWPEILWPLNTPIVSEIFNKYVVRSWPFFYLALTNFIIARKRPVPSEEESLVSVIIPARNEEGNIEEIIRRTPEMGRGTELVFVEGNSRDHTYEAIERAIAHHPEKKIRLFKQKGKGKGDAVRLGFQNASGDIFMILDADMTVPPEDLPRFYNAIISGEGEFINGVRLIYPMEKQAMRYLNLVGNKFFSMAFSWLLGQPIKDTLCGTKVLRKQDYEKIARNRSYFGDFDPFGDFDLIFGAAKQNLKIVEMPIRYAERRYGTTNIDRWRHGLVLLRMVLFALKRIKFL